MILIGGDKFPESMTGVAEVSDADLHDSAAVSALNIWVPDVAFVVGSVLPYPQVYMYPADSRGFWLKASTSDVQIVQINTAEETLTGLRPGVATLTWAAENADGSQVTYQQKVTVTAT